MTHAKGTPQWAPKVPRSKIRRLYETDAQGIVDIELIDEVGWALWQRCDSILTVTAAHNGHVYCPQCGTVIERQNLLSEDETIVCGNCGWQIPWAIYHQSYRGKQLFGANAVDIFAVYHQAFPHAQAPNEKMLLIDQLIHAFHIGVKEIGRPVASNLIEGSLKEVIQFLDMLSSGNTSASGIGDSQGKWRRTLAAAEWTEQFRVGDRGPASDMAIRIEHQPESLLYQQFQTIDVECFPGEPVDQAGFQTFLEQDFWAAWNGKVLVGYCSAHQTGNLFWIRRIAVATSYRRQGIARQLMEAAIVHCQRIRLLEIMLYVQQDNLPAMALYESFGFEEADTTYQFIWQTTDSMGQMSAAALPRIKMLPVSEVPEAKMPELPPQWKSFRDMHDPPNQHAFVFFDEKGDNIGYCRLSPGFPGCFPFVIHEPESYLAGVLQGLKKYLLPEKEHLKLTINDEALANICSENGLTLNYRLYKMVRAI
jgi:GNAT superfamily N-acetyltransferase/predicted RNA-binding Zn-ribbon protein involved in translation (DUF1610 family)